MQIKVKSSIQVQKPPSLVFDYLSDLDRMPEWQSSNFDVKGKKNPNAKGKLKKGTSVHDRRNVLGKKIDGEWEVAEYEEDKKLVCRVTNGPVPWQMTFTLEPFEKGTLLSAEGGGDMGDLRIPYKAAALSCQHMLENDLETLQEILEG